MVIFRMVVPFLNLVSFRDSSSEVRCVRVIQRLLYSEKRCDSAQNYFNFNIKYKMVYNWW